MADPTATAASSAAVPPASPVPSLELLELTERGVAALERIAGSLDRLEVHAEHVEKLAGETARSAVERFDALRPVLERIGGNGAVRALLGIGGKR